jgi:exodeoxyribonuclease V alpha subunit
MEQTDNFLKGRIEHITYRNEENGYTVLDLDSDGELVTVVGIMPPVAEGEHLSVRGLWVFNQRFGRQFSADSVECELPQSLDEIFSYLASGDIKGIGPKTAEKIIEKFKEDSLDVIENHPEKLSEISGISLNKAEQIMQSYKERFGVREIIMRFKKYGISNSEAIRIYKVFGASSVSKVENNPYVLSSNVGFSFDRADDIAERLDKKLMDFRTVAGIKHILQHNANLNGHTCIPKDKLIPLVAQFLDYSSDDVELHLDLATDKGDFIIKEFDGEEFVFLRSLYDAENSVAKKLITRINLSFNVENDLSKEIKRLEKRENIIPCKKRRLNRR